MEMYCSLEENNMHMLAIDRQGYHLGPAVDHQRPKRQNRARLVPSHWDIHNETPGTLEEVHSGPRFEDESFERGCRHDLAGLTGAYQGGSLEENNVTGYHGVANLYSLHGMQRNMWPRMPYHLYTSGPEGTLTRDLATNTEYCRGRTDVGLHNRNNYTGQAFNNMHEVWNYNIGVGGNCYVDPLVSRHRLPLLGSEPSEGLVESSSGFGHPHNGRRGSWKRKRSTASITGSFSFETSHSSGIRDRDSHRMINGARLNAPSFTAASSAYGTHTLNAAHMLSDFHNTRGISMGAQNDNMIGFFRESDRSSVSFSGTNGTFQSSVHMRPSNTPCERALFHFHVPQIMDLRRMPCPQLRHTFSDQQSMVLSTNGMWNSSSICNTDCWVPSVVSQRPSLLSTAGSWGQNPLSSGEGDRRAGLVALPGMPSSFDGCYYPRSLPLGTVDWLRTASIDSRLVRQAYLDPRILTITMARNAPDNYVYAYQAGASSLVYPNSSASRSHLSTVPVAGPAQGNMTHLSSSAVTNHLIPDSMEEAPSVSVYQLPYPSTIQPHHLVNSHDENFIVQHLQSISVMPFQRLHMLQTDAENQNDVSSEELVMLNQSVVLGGIDILDQHSDMRLDVDNMSYEELLALEERIGSVSTGLSEEAITKCLRTSVYVSLDDTSTAVSKESDVKCCICQEEYVKDDKLGRLECEHSYHIPCIKQWLAQKNQCPICKTTACSNP